MAERRSPGWARDRGSEAQIKILWYRRSERQPQRPSEISAGTGGDEAELSPVMFRMIHATPTARGKMT